MFHLGILELKKKMQEKYFDRCLKVDDTQLQHRRKIREFFRLTSSIECSIHFQNVSKLNHPTCFAKEEIKRLTDVDLASASTNQYNELVDHRTEKEIVLSDIELGREVEIEIKILNKKQLDHIVTAKSI